MIANIKMVEELNKIFPLDERIKKAFIEIDRREFVPEGLLFDAYKIDSLPLTNDSTISSPLTVAKMTTYLEIDKKVDSVLEIGAGSGYQSAILSKLVRRVFAIERIKSLVEKSRKRFKKLKLYNINLKYGDGANGWENFAPFDRILFSATIDYLPDSILEQLSDRGVVVAPIRNGDREVITQFKKIDNRIIKRELETANFVPLKRGVE